MFTDLYHMIRWPKYFHVYGIIIQRQIVCKTGDDQVSTSANIFTCFVWSDGTRYCYVFVYFRVLQGYQQTYYYRR